jgi:hypothetical protein
VWRKSHGPRCGGRHCTTTLHQEGDNSPCPPLTSRFKGPKSSYRTFQTVLLGKVFFNVRTQSMYTPTPPFITIIKIWSDPVLLQTAMLNWSIYCPSARDYNGNADVNEDDNSRVAIWGCHPSKNIVALGASAPRKCFDLTHDMKGTIFIMSPSDVTKSQRQQMM